MTRQRVWATGLVAVWTVALLVAAVWSAHFDPATVRSQSELSEGRQTVDRAVEQVTAAAGPDAAVDVRPYEVTHGCQLTVARQGTELDRTVVITVPEGEEPALLDRLVERLPDDWGARHNPHTHRFSADAGDFVALRGTVAGPGQVEIVAGTGCRPGVDPVAEQPGAGQ